MVVCMSTVYVTLCIHGMILCSSHNMCIFQMFFWLLFPPSILPSFSRESPFYSVFFFPSYMCALVCVCACTLYFVCFLFVKISIQTRKSFSVEHFVYHFKRKIHFFPYKPLLNLTIVRSFVRFVFVCVGE